MIGRPGLLAGRFLLIFFPEQYLFDKLLRRCVETPTRQAPPNGASVHFLVYKSVLGLHCVSAPSFSGETSLWKRSLDDGLASCNTKLALAGRCVLRRPAGGLLVDMETRNSEMDCIIGASLKPG